MSALAANISGGPNADRTITVDAGPAPTPGTLLLVDDELIAFGSLNRLTTPPYAAQLLVWNVQRGMNGTTKASHLIGAELTEVRPVYGGEATDQGGGGTLAEVLAEGNITATGTSGGISNPPYSMVSADDGTGGTGAKFKLRDADNSNPGTAWLGGGDGLTGIDGGAVELTSGSGGGDSGSGADVYVGGGVADGTGGKVAIQAGYAITDSDANGGDVTIDAGGGDGAGALGNIILATLPTSDPLVLGALYSDGVPSADTPRVLKISGGTAP